MARSVVSKNKWLEECGGMAIMSKSVDLGTILSTFTTAHPTELRAIQAVPFLVVLHRYLLLKNTDLAIIFFTAIVSLLVYDNKRYLSIISQSWCYCYPFTLLSILHYQLIDQSRLVH